MRQHGDLHRISIKQFPILLPLKQPRSRKADNSASTMLIRFEDNWFAVNDSQRKELLTERRVKMLESVEVEFGLVSVD